MEHSIRIPKDLETSAAKSACGFSITGSADHPIMTLFPPGRSPITYVKLANATESSYVTSLLICFQDVLKYMGKFVFSHNAHVCTQVIVAKNLDG